MASIELWAIWQVVCFLMLWHARLLVLISADIHIALVQSFLLTGQCSNFTHSLNTLFYAAATGYSHANTHRLTFKTGVKYSATPKAVPFTEFMTFCMLEEASPRQMNSRRDSNELYLINTAYRVCLKNV